MTINNTYNNPSPSPSTKTIEKIVYVYNSYGQKVLGTTSTVYTQPQTTTVETKGGTPQVVYQAPTDIKELPRTGLPLIALGLASLFPGGLIFKRFSKKRGEGDESATSIWMEKQFKN